MPTGSQELRDRLLQSDDEFRQLAAKHREFEDRLQELTSKPRLSDVEQLEEVTLKKRKLQLKDRMEEIVRRHGTGGLTAGSEVTTTASAQRA